MTLDMRGCLQDLARSYPSDMVEEQLRDVPRIASHIGLAMQRFRPEDYPLLSLADLGGGVGLFSLGCAAFGLRHVVLIDDFDNDVNHRCGDSVLDLHRTAGIEVVTRDVIAHGILDIPGQFDIVTTFDSMEHWHHSPKRLFSEVAAKLKPGGVFLLGVPNCVNLRKRLTVPFGRGKWSAMLDWYEAPVFRGHVREPDVDDLLYIARDMGLVQCEIIGRNWLGHLSGSRVIRLASALFDYPLRLRPQLCSDIYLLGQKPG